MADWDWIDVCLNCMTPVEKFRRCPLCEGKIKRISSLAFETLRMLRDKGYKPLSCRLLGFGKNKSVAVVFDGYSPGRGVHGEMHCQLDKENRAVCSTWRVKGGSQAYREAHEWSQETTPLKRNLPFNRELCCKCSEQHSVEWLHGVCQCPRAGLLGSEKPGATGPYEFERGLPHDCLYLAEQVMTRHKVAASLDVELEK